jgi:hypothetical protein
MHPYTRKVYESLQNQAISSVWKSMTGAYLRDVREKIKVLIMMERTPVEISNQCSGENIPDCSIIDVLHDNQGFS